MEDQNPIDVIKEVKAPLLFVVGSNDALTPPDMCRWLYEAANEAKRWVLIEGADHGFSNHRYQMMNSVVDWIGDHL